MFELYVVGTLAGLLLKVFEALLRIIVFLPDAMVLEVLSQRLILMKA